MYRKPLAILATAVACFAVSPVHAQETGAGYDDTHVGSVTESFAAGMTEYALGNYAKAYDHLFAAAIRDHAQAQEVIGMMRLAGATMYGAAVAQDTEEATFWLGEAARQGREAALHVHCALTSKRQQAFAAVQGVQPNACKAA